MKDDIVNELHRSVRKRYRRRHYRMVGLNDHWQVDLVDVSSIARFNRKHPFILTVIDTFSKQAYARALKSKGGDDVTKAMKSIFDDAGVSCSILQSDMGKEFLNKHFQNLLRGMGIKHFTSYSDMKVSFTRIVCNFITLPSFHLFSQCAIVERFNRSLKEIMWKSFTLKSSYNWIDHLQEYLDFYNKRVHRTIKIAPCDVNEENAAQIMKTAYDYSNEAVKHPKYAVGDYVRISKYKSVFEKGYTMGWSVEIFKITHVNNQFNPETYHIADINDEPILGQFYRENLQRVKHKDGYLVEKVLKRKPGKNFVKFLGFSSQHNAWIDAETDQ